MIMSKFQKRLSKLSKHHETAVVIGCGFGQLDKIIQVYNTVFVIGPKQPAIKSKNLIYRETFDNISHITEVAAVFYDLDQIPQLEKTSQAWLRNKSMVIIEGNDPIDRSLSKFLYASIYECTGLHGSFHVWELKK
jgi:hypothetical protein